MRTVVLVGVGRKALHLQHDRSKLEVGNSMTNCLQTRPKLRLLAF